MIKTLLSIILIFSGLHSFSQIPTNNLVLHYQFNNNTEDISSNEFDATNNGAVSSTDRSGVANSAYVFDGSSTYIEVPNETLLKPDFPFTISLWFKIDAINSTSKCLYASDEDNNKYSGFWVSYRSDQKISVGYGNGIGLGTTNRVTKHSNTVIQSNSGWHHVVARFNGLNDIDLYIDCNIDAGTYSGSATEMTNLGNPGVIGRNLGHNTDSYHDGGIDDIRLYDRALTNSEITALCNEEGNTVSIKSEEDQKIEIYPNPASENIYLKGNNSLIGSRVLIYNTIGEEVYSSILSNSELSINLKKLGKSGMYFIQISNSNSIITTKKIILQ